jgi:hypothetical protein
MVFNMDYPSIVIDGLLLNLDAGFTPSYPKNGTTWYDTSSGGNNGTLINSPSYNDTSKSIVLDGGDDFIDTGKTAAQFGFYNGSYTMEAWVYPTDLSNDRTMFGTDQSSYGTGLHLVFRNGVIYQGHYGSDFGAGSVSANIWYQIVYTYNASNNVCEIFKNGVSQGSGNITPFVGTTNILLSRWGGGGYFQGNGLRYRIYNLVLTPAEILQNYYQGSIVTSGLVLALDGSNIISYPKSGTEWYDMSGNNYKVTNCNFQMSTNGYYSLWSNGNDADIASSAILDNDYHTIEFLLMFKGSSSYPNGYTGGWEQFFGYFGSGSDRTPGIWRFPSSRIIHWQYAPGFNGPNFGKNAANEEFDLNKYYSIIVTKDGGTVKTYINGVLTNTVGASFPKTPGSSIVRFYDYYTSDLMEIQVCRIYNRALTQQEVTINYNSVSNKI